MTTSMTDRQILAHLGHADAEELGAGGEARVFALDEERIARLLHPGAALADAQARAALLAEIADGAAHLPFRTPEVQEVRDIGGRVVTIEARLAGLLLPRALALLDGRRRGALMCNYLDMAAMLSGIALKRAFFGPILGDPTARRASWAGYLDARKAQSAAASPGDLRRAITAIGPAGLPDPQAPRLVHLDYFPGNVLAAGETITAVLDFGVSAIMGDSRMECWSAVAYLDTEISPDLLDVDRRHARDWLAEHDLLEHFPAARKWLAAYWSFAQDDAALMRWCRKILLGNSRKAPPDPPGNEIG